MNPSLSGDERLDQLADGRVGLADDSRLGHRRMIGQRVLHLERTDQVPGGLDHVVGAADEPEVAVRVALGEVAGQIQVVGEALAVALFLVADNRGTSTASPDLSASSPSTSGSSITETVPSSLRCTTYASTPGSGRPIEPGLMSNAGVLAIMMPPVSVCHQLSWIGSPSTRFPHQTASGLSGSPTLAMNRRCGKRYALREFRPGLDQHADRGRRGVPDRDGLVVQDAVPALGVEFGLVDDRGDAVQQRGDHSRRTCR